MQRITFQERSSKSTKASFASGDVLYGKLRPYLNKVLVADRHGFCTTEILPLRPREGVDPHYLKTALKTPQFLKYVNSKSYGMKMPRLGTDDARQALVPLPPLAEQRRIVLKVDQLLGLCDELAASQAARREAHSALVGATLDRLVSRASNLNTSSPSPRFGERGLGGEG